MESIISIVIILMNVLAFALFGLDKSYAIRRAWRIPEKTLLVAALFLGAGGAYLGMRFFHHKTRKAVFAIGIPLLLLLQIGLFFYYYFFIKLR